MEWKDVIDAKTSKKWGLALAAMACLWQVPIPPELAVNVVIVGVIVGMKLGCIAAVAITAIIAQAKLDDRGPSQSIEQEPPIETP